MSLWTFSQSEQKIESPYRRVSIIPIKSQRASFYTCQKASYTIEAAVIIPLIAGYMVTMLFFFYILKIQCVVDEAVLYAGRKTAVESSMIDDEGALFISAEAYLLHALKDDARIEKYVKHGVLGIRLWNSEFEGEEIILRAEYEVKLPITFLGVRQVELCSQNCFRKWTGDRPAETDKAFVYVTETGEVYHASLSCRSIHLSVQECYLEEIPFLRGKNGQKYYECTRCKWKDNNIERVYYTDYGTLYHKDIACSALKRNVEKIKLEDVGSRRPCSFCYKS